MYVKIMSRNRAFIFHIENMTKPDWDMVVKLKTNTVVVYLCACIENNCINGVIRFNNAKSQSSVENIFNKRAIVVAETRNDMFYASLCYGKDKFFEHGNKSYVEKESVEKMYLEIAKQILANQNLLAQQMVSNNNINVTNNANTTNNNTTNNNTTNNNTTNNNRNKINLQFFLNERCKDAMNMGDFAKTVPINLDDILYFKNHSHSEGITRIIENGLNNLELTQRPIHCTDAKRETLHIKDEGKWINDQKKEIIGKAIQTVAHRSFRGIDLWKTANPEYNYDEDMKTEYALLMKKLLGCNNEEENKEKIIRNISRISHLEREKIAI
jgi:hypothetical protein